jgi:hypothetical protein
MLRILEVDPINLRDVAAAPGFQGMPGTWETPQAMFMLRRVRARHQHNMRRGSVVPSTK